MSERRIAVFSATRADYGLLRPILGELQRAEDLELHLIVAGAHLAPSHGYTVSEVERDGFPIASRVESLLDSDTSVGTSHSMALTLQGVATALAELAPDLFVVLGDRYEALGAAAAAMMARVPIAHLHGGEVTEGAIDEAVRHSITKMAHLHLVAAEPFRERVLQLGEEAERVHVVGAPGLDNIRSLELLSREELGEALGWDPGPSYLLVTHHPATLQPGQARGEIDALVRALEAQTERRVLVTAPNADPESGAIRDRLEGLATGDPDRFHFVTSLGQHRYLSALRHAAAVVGNSSSGIVEAPFLGTPTVNIGDRQRGRPRASSIVECSPAPAAISAAIDSAVAIDAAETESLYGDGRTAPRVIEVLRHTRLDGLLLKSFQDIDVVDRRLHGQ